MDTDFDPVNQLTTLLGPTPTHPWEALIPQILLWSFRRFCIIKLCKTAETPITEQIWDDHMELIRVYAPKGLECVTTTWITDENIEYVHSSLRDYNIFFLNILTMIDSAYEHSDTVAEDIISKFLDAEMPQTVNTWMGDLKDFLIFPMSFEYEDEFTDDQFAKVLTALMEYSKKYEEEVEEEQLLDEPVEQPDELDMEQYIQQYMEQPDELDMEQYIQHYMEKPEEKPEENTELEVKTVQEAIARRRTLKNIKVDLRRKTRKLLYT